MRFCPPSAPVEWARSIARGDPRLGRDVAIKVLPPGFSADPERLDRFEQEARAAAALNHPNILAVYDIGQHDAAPYIVSELLDGETLREVLASGSGLQASAKANRPEPKPSGLPVRKAVECAVQIAHGLAAAHEKGVVHRDLKPENVFVTSDSRVKILDFGLAKLTQAEPAFAGLSALPTTPPNTQAGMVLGTIGYMSPERVRGLPADHRSDLFAFGAVLYEMLSGQRAFHGETAMDAMTAIVKDHPADLPSAERKIPLALVRIVDRCLEKSPAARFQTATDLAFALEALSTVSTTSGAADTLVGVATTPRGRERAAWTIAAALGLVALASLASTVVLIRRPVPTEQPSIQFMVSPPEGWSTRTATGGTHPLAISPDGRRLAFIAADTDGRTMAWVRSLGATIAQSLKGTENAGSLFWSPDSRFLAFDAGGGPPETIADMAANYEGTWSPDGIILFSASGNGGLSRVSAMGGAAGPITTLDQGEIRHDNPHFLPDGQHFLYGSFAGSQQHLRRFPEMAQAFDAERLELVGDPSPVAEIQASGTFDVSPTGVLAYQSGTDATRSQLAWFDRTGQLLGVLGDPQQYFTVQISPDGTRVASIIHEESSGSSAVHGDVWVYDLAGGGRTKLTFDPTNTAGSAVWSPDGSRVVFAKTSGGKGSQDLFERASTGAGDVRAILEDSVTKAPWSWSSDGRFLLYLAVPGSPTTGNDLWVLPLSGGRKPFPFVQTRFNEGGGQFSPDGRWVAYQSNESGRREIYVAAFPGAGGKRLISTAGGGEPRWRRDGKELFYLAPNNMLMAAAVNGEGTSFEVASVKALFETKRSGTNLPYDVSADGQRFLIISASDDASASGITVAVNGTAGLEN